MPKEFYIIRHGETDLNRLGIVQGRGVNSPLNEQGHRQAARFYERYRHIPFDKLYTSTLRRTWETVHSFIEGGLKWEKLSGLDEMDWGKLEGMPSSPETKERFRQLLQAWVDGNYEESMEGGESPLEVLTRQKIALEYILRHTEEKTVLICMHGRAMRLFLCLLTQTDISQMDTFPHQNLSMYRLTFDEGNFTLIDFNNTAHVAENILKT